MEPKKYALAMEEMLKPLYQRRKIELAKRAENDKGFVKNLLKEKAHMLKFGIADCHGIESYIGGIESEGHKLALLNIRARANRQRHCVVYRVEITTDTDKKVQDALKLKKYILALSILKKEANRTWFPDEHMRKSWELIPNPKLDPWG